MFDRINERKCTTEILDNDKVKPPYSSPCQQLYTRYPYRLVIPLVHFRITISSTNITIVLQFVVLNVLVSLF